MNRNSNSHYSNTPQLTMNRSRFDRSCGYKTTFDSCYLTPFYYEDVLPGDTVSLSTSLVVRMSTPTVPVMDNCNLDVYYFFVPNRLVWEHWKDFCGEAENVSQWNNPTNYQIPQLTIPLQVESGIYNVFGWSHYSVADYFGLTCTQSAIEGRIPDDISELPSVSALPFRAYGLIWNEFFRSQQLQDPVYVPMGDATERGKLGNARPDFEDSFASAVYGGSLLPVNKYFDYFTSALPSPQRGPAVTLPLGLGPVYCSNEFNPYNLDYSASGEGTLCGWNLSSGGEGFPSEVLVSTLDSENPSPFQPTNLVVDQSSIGTINDLRLAFAVQRFMELQNRAGSRYTEVVRAFFGVTSPDARLQRPEYIGGKQIPINISQVLQTSATDTTSPQGNASGFSLTSDTSENFTYSATEHGMIIGLMCVRPVHTYQNGIDRKWSRKSRYDFYWPTFANISEQPIYNKELFFSGYSRDDEVFGYQEAWADYRYGMSHVTGAMRSYNDVADVPGDFTSLDIYHYADNYNTTPALSADWIRDDPNLIDRTLAGGGTAESITKGQEFIIDMWFDSVWSRVMPVYSVPGLIDHN